ncbi:MULTISPECIES: Lrp/AsnC family transcriptional regulator [unclassified Streptomyces]|uniref:Lrp/AsnC family transcriptional regulator n=1 Tax=unclassified Streptomyces TaxID=2593676 RepID=UPI00190B6A47|nr:MULTISPECIES: AsnC family transcriptional regulator [unclassified Streptomyces]MBK3565301.1 AsnC family transcriptional regulator [Streptomyces sp. MBT62]MBK6015280.1 AsnC family transcriptional regulator [Streptomyces sp. MBT53]
MDRTDRRIVQCLLRDGRASFRRIADVAEVSEQTVARRYRALVADGAVRVRALPSHVRLGDQTWFVRVRCRPDATDALADALAAREDTAYVSVTSGGSEIVCQTHTGLRDQGGSVLQRLPRTARVLGFDACAVMHMYVGSDAKWLAFDDPLSDDQAALLHTSDQQQHTTTGSAADLELRDQDAPLMAELARDGRAGVVELARVCGWSKSRVSARLDELLAAGALRVAVDLAYPRFGFHAPAYLWLTVAPGRLDATGELLSAHPETTFAAAVTGSANLLVTVTCRTMDDLFSYVTTKVGALEAVRQVDVVPVLHRLKQAGTRLRDGRLIPT